jgi:ribosomal protein S12 methylthiotransferase
MQQVQFDRVGIFPYYPEDGTPAATLPGQVSDRTKQARKRQALELQQRISERLNQRFIGREVEVLVEGQADRKSGGREMDVSHGTLVGRTYRDAPEVDGFVLFDGSAKPGDLVRVRVSGAGPYDLFGAQV